MRTVPMAARGEAGAAADVAGAAAAPDLPAPPASVAASGGMSGSSGASTPSSGSPVLSSRFAVSSTCFTNYVGQRSTTQYISVDVCRKNQVLMR